MELLIVIVVIAILAAISIVAYNGIQNRARASAASSALSQAAKKIAVWQVDNPGATPDCGTFNSLIGATGTACTATSSDVEYQFKPGAVGAYCITATSGTVSYKVSEATSPSTGACVGHGSGGSPAITNYQPNPKLSVDTFGFSTQTPSGNTATRTTGTGPSGEATYNVTLNAAGQLRMAFKSNSVSFPVVAGEQYNFSFYMNSSVAMPASNIEVNFQSPNVYAFFPIGDVSTGWNRYNAVVTVPSGSSFVASAQFISGSGSGVPSGTIVRMTKVQITKGASLYGFADGDTSGWRWNGTPNAATSTGSAP